MNKSIGLCLALIIALAINTPLNVYAGNYPADIEWYSLLGGDAQDYANSIQITSDGGYIVAGSTTSNDGYVSSNHGSEDAWIVKLGSTGNLDWSKTFGGSDYDTFKSIQQTSDGGYIAVGFTNSVDGDSPGTKGLLDAWIVKLDSIGNIIWNKTLGGTGNDFAYCIQQTNDGGYIVTGYTDSRDGDFPSKYNSYVGSGLTDAWSMKLDSMGNVIWSKCIGGTGVDEAFSIQQTSDGGYIMAGTSGSNDGDVYGNHGETDVWVVKLDSEGNIFWSISLGGSNYEGANSIQQTSDGGYIVGAFSASNDGDVFGNHGANEDYWIVKLDPKGNIIWSKCLGGTSSERAYSVKQTTDKGYIVLGEASSYDGDVSGNHTSPDLWIVKLDPNGNTTWSRCLGGTDADFAGEIQVSSDGGYVVAGYTYSSNGDVTGKNCKKYGYKHRSIDAWIFKLPN